MGVRNGGRFWKFLEWTLGEPEERIVAVGMGGYGYGITREYPRTLEKRKELLNERSRVQDRSEERRETREEGAL